MTSYDQELVQERAAILGSVEEVPPHLRERWQALLSDPTGNGYTNALLMSAFLDEAGGDPEMATALADTYHRGDDLDAAWDRLTQKRYAADS
jgi:hypothetical protein